MSSIISFFRNPLIWQNKTRVNFIVTTAIILLLALPYVLSGTPNWVAPFTPRAVKQVEMFAYDKQDPGTAAATSSRPDSPAVRLNDGSKEPYRSADTNDDTIAYITRSEPFAAKAVVIANCAKKGDQYLRDVSVVASSMEGSWTIIPAKLKGEAAFAEKITLPETEDGALTRLELDEKAFKTTAAYSSYGIAVYSVSKGYTRNYLSTNIVCIREMRLE